MDASSLALRMRTVAEHLSDPVDEQVTLERIASAACRAVQGGDFVSISVRHPDGSLETLVATDAVVRELDELQYALREGPCYEAVTEGISRTSPDIASDGRWPTFGPLAAERGIASQMAIRMPGHAHDVTGLNLYARQPHAFDDRDGIAELFACQAGIALGYAREVDSLRRALRSRGDIGAAVGLVMARYRLTQERGFEFLVRLSTTSNVKLRQVAAQLIADAETQ